MGPPTPSGGGQALVLAEDGRLEVLQLAARLDAELLDQHLARIPEGPKRLRLPPGAVERQHPQRSQALAKRVLGDQYLELRRRLGRPAKIELGLDPPLDRSEAKLVQPRRDRPHRGDLGEVGECRAAPERERLRQPGGGSGRIAGLTRGHRLRDEPLEVGQVEVVGADRQHIAVAPRRDRVAAQRFAQLRDVALDQVGRGLGRIVVPDTVDQPLGRDRSVCLGEEERQQDALPRPADRDRIAVDEDLERPEDPELSCHGGTGAGRPSPANSLRSLRDAKPVEREAEDAVDLIGVCGADRGEADERQRETAAPRRR